MSLFSLVKKLRAKRASKAASRLARHGAQMRREPLEQRRKRLHEELRQYVETQRALTTGDGFLP